MSYSKRTIEVVPKKDNPYGSHEGWTFSGTYWGNRVYERKKNAVDKAKSIAKKAASREGHSVEVKIFGKDGDWLREHVYKP